MASDSKVYHFDEVAQHKYKKDCWIIVSGKVGLFSLCSCLKYLCVLYISISGLIYLLKAKPFAATHFVMCAKRNYVLNLGVYRSKKQYKGEFK
jgi:hypothetical protein